jgi:hypothetical protein
VKFNCAFEDCNSKFVLLPTGEKQSVKVTNLGPVQANGSGSFTKTFNVPNYLPGGYPIGATGSQSLNLVKTIFTITAPFGIQVAPTSGPGGMNAVVTGQGFQPNEQVTLKFNCARKDCTSIQSLVPGANAQKTTVRTLGPVNADGSGTISKNIVIPIFNQGTWTIGAIGATGDFTTTTFTITAPLTPAITVTPNSGVSGAVNTSTSTKVTVNGSGYLPNEPVTVKFNCATATCGSTQLMGTPTTDGSGNFSLINVQIPSKWSNGPVKIGAKGGSSNAFATNTFTVTGQA